MKKFLILILLITNQVIAAKLDKEFYEPSVSNNYQGRLFSSNESYPIDKMKKLCAPFTGIDTAQIKCRRQYEKQSFICEYKCSLHWMTDQK